MDIISSYSKIRKNIESQPSGNIKKFVKKGWNYYWQEDTSVYTVMSGNAPDILVDQLKSPSSCEFTVSLDMPGSGIFYVYDEDTNVPARSLDKSDIEYSIGNRDPGNFLHVAKSINGTNLDYCKIKFLGFID